MWFATLDQKSSDGSVKVSGRNVVGQSKSLQDGGPHYPVHSYQHADCCPPEGHVVLRRKACGPYSPELLLLLEWSLGETLEVAAPYDGQ